jgi:hypothetical protein
MSISRCEPEFSGRPAPAWGAAVTCRHGTHGERAYFVGVPRVEKSPHEGKGMSVSSSSEWARCLRIPGAGASQSRHFRSGKPSSPREILRPWHQARRYRKRSQG